MGFVVYVLQSEKTGNYYVGHTDDPVQRLAEHNAGVVRSTRARRPWRLAYTEPFGTRGEAMARELRIKAWKSADAIRRLIG